MPLERLDIRYRDAVANVQLIRIASLSAQASLKRFPANVPGDFGEGLVGLVNHLRAQLEALEGARDDAQFKGQILPGDGNEPSSDAPHPVLEPFVLLAMAKSYDQSRLIGIDFAQIALHQELVGILAQFEAFLGDAIRAICSVRPEVLNRNRQIAWKDAIRCGSWSSLIELLVEEYVLETSRLSITERIALLRKDLSIDAALNDQAIETINIAEQIRHVILHNGSRVSAEYQKRLNAYDEKIGDEIVLDDQVVTVISRTVCWSLGRVFLAVMNKFADADSAPIKLVPATLVSPNGERS